MELVLAERACERRRAQGPNSRTGRHHTTSIRKPRAVLYSTSPIAIGAVLAQVHALLEQISVACVVSTRRIPAAARWRKGFFSGGQHKVPDQARQLNRSRGAFGRRLQDIAHRAIRPLSEKVRILGISSVRPRGPRVRHEADGCAIHANVEFARISCRRGDELSGHQNAALAVRSV